MKKAILFLEQQSWISGAQRVLETVLNSVDEEFDCIVAFPDSGPFCRALENRKIDTIVFPLGNYQSGQKSYPEMLAFAARSLVCGLKLAQFIKQRGIELVYINGPRCLPAGILAARLTGCPALFHLHLTLTRRSEIFLVTRLARYASKIVACSQASAQPLLNAEPGFSEKIRILYNPAPDRTSEVRKLPAQSSTHLCRTLGMVGRITEAKGQHTLLRALGSLRPGLRENIRLLFVGAPAPENRDDQAYARRLQALVADLRLEDRVSWVGYQSDPAPYYASMEVLVHPSSSLSGEAMPLAVLEALQKGIPVIASRTGGIPEVVRDGVNGLLVPPGDEGMLALALERFFEDQALRERLIQGARAGLDDRFALKNFRSGIREQIWKLCSPPTLEEMASRRRELAAWK